MAIWDWGLTRLSVFDEGGTFIRSVAISYASRPPQLAGYLGDGTWLFTTDFSFGPGETSRVVRDTTPYLRFDADGTLLDTLLTSPAAEYFVQGTSQFAMGSRLLFGRGHAWATFAGGFYAGVTDQFDIRRYTADGALEVVIRRARGSRRVTAAAVEAARADRLQRIRSPAARPRIERFYAEMPVPGAMLAFEALVVDETGNLWRIPGSDDGDAPLVDRCPRRDPPGLGRRPPRSHAARRRPGLHPRLLAG